MDKIRTTLITGATGFIGGRIVEVLYLTGHRKVRAAIRQWSSAARLGRFPVDIVQMDLMKPEQITKALEGVDEIIHCAKGAYDVTVEGTRNLLEAALQKKIKRFIHFSTTEVYGNVTGEIDESATLQYTGNEYNRMKIDAEKICWEYSKKGLPITVLRPSIVYGPFSNNWSVRFAQMFLKGEWGIYEKLGEGKCNLVFIDDLVHAAITCLDNESAVGQAFNINGPEIVSWNDYFRRFNKAMGLPELNTIREGKANLRTAAMLPVRFAGKVVKNHFMEPVKKMAEIFPVMKKAMLKTEHQLKITPVKDEFRMFGRDAVISSVKLDKHLNNKPVVDLKTGLRITIDWLKVQGIMNYINNIQRNNHSILG